MTSKFRGISEDLYDTLSGKLGFSDIEKLFKYISEIQKTAFNDGYCASIEKVLANIHKNNSEIDIIDWCKNELYKINN